MYNLASLQKNVLGLCIIYNQTCKSMMYSFNQWECARRCNTRPLTSTTFAPNQYRCTSNFKT